MLYGRNIGEILGYTSAGLSTILFIPQVYQIIKTRNTESINSIYLCLEVTNSIVNIGYGLSLDEYPIIISASSILFCTLIISSYKIRNYLIEKKKEDPYYYYYHD